MASEISAVGKEGGGQHSTTLSDIHTLAITSMSKEEKLQIYSVWSNTYEKYSIDGDYIAWPICMEKVLSVVPELAKDTAPKPVQILDTGCGTGYLGKLINEECKRRELDVSILGLDFSPEMVEQTRKKECYDTLVVGDITERLADEVQNVDVVVAVGVFLEGHVDASALPNMLECLRENGIGVFTIRSATVEKRESEYLKAVAESKCEIIERDEQLYFMDIRAEYWTVKKLA